MSQARLKTFFLKDSFFQNLTIHNLGKEAQDRPAAALDVEIINKYSTSYPIDDGVWLNENCK